MSQSRKFGSWCFFIAEAASIGSLIFMNKRSVMKILPQSVTKLWNEWEVRALVLLSLFLQIVLILLGNRRKYIPSKWIRIIIWLAYLAADWIAAVSIGVLSNSQGDSEDDSLQQTNIIRAFWAPFLLLHLGGPDTITAYSLEDNELWLRHFLALVIQFGGTFYIFLRSWKSKLLNILAIPIFVAGLIKYGERTWVLRSASSSQFREPCSLVLTLGLIMPKSSAVYSAKSQGFNVSFEPVAEPSTKVNCLDPDEEILQVGYALFMTFKRLFADLILTFQDRKDSQSFFHNTTWEKAFVVIEVELGFMYDVLYTKASVTYCRWGHLLRAVSLSFTVSTSVAFLLINKQEYATIDLVITLLLLVGAIVLEMYAIIILLSSDWTMLWVKMDRANKRWSNSMAQYNLLSLCLKEKPIKYLGPVQRLPYICEMLKKYRLGQHEGILWRFSRVYEMLEEHSYKTSVTVSTDLEILNDLKEFIFEHLSDKSNSAKEQSDANAIYKQLCAGRGDLVLKKEKYNCHSILGWSVEEDFEQSILLWHIATDLLYHTDNQDQNPSLDKCPDYRAMCKLVSDYMLYLLVMRPSMLPDGIGHMRFRDSRAEGIQFFKDKAIIEGRTEACQKLLEVNTEVPPLQVEGDKSKSMLFEACRLAKSLQSLEITEKEKWEMMCDVWVEMLCYAASQCGWNQHAKQLRRGGELLTHVWLLMAHFGISEHFKISLGHARSVVVVT
ncbi:hypothetical protein AAG906_022942 [Vitis piasezkii]